MRKELPRSPKPMAQPASRAGGARTQTPLASGTRGGNGIDHRT
jgi:hypothetical protein